MSGKTSFADNFDFATARESFTRQWLVDSGVDLAALDTAWQEEEQRIRYERAQAAVKAGTDPVTRALKRRYTAVPKK